jgi:bifunctional DNase/RNase
MQDNVVEVKIRAIVPTANGCALFLGHSSKTYVIYIDQLIGQQINLIQNKIPRERPMTHDLIHNLLKGLGASIERVIINHTDNGTFYARIIIKMQNELGIKLLELDARPSDSIALALESERPIYTAQSVLDAVVDMTDVLERILKQGGV